VRCGIVVIFCTIVTPNLPGRSVPSLRQVEWNRLRSPDLNACSERWVRSVKEERLSKVLLIGERSLRLALSEYIALTKRNHQGKDNVLLLVTRKRDEAGLCNVAKGWAGFCIMPRNPAEKSRMILWLKVDCTCARPTMLLANAQVSPNIACAVDR
jgi:hypothetical protein